MRKATSFESASFHAPPCRVTFTSATGKWQRGPVARVAMTPCSTASTKLGGMASSGARFTKRLPSPRSAGLDDEAHMGEHAPPPGVTLVLALALPALGDGLLVGHLGGCPRGPRPCNPRFMRSTETSR